LRKRLQAALKKHVASNCAFAQNERGAQPLFALYRMLHAEAILASIRTALQSHASVLRWQQEIGARAVDFSGRSAAFHNLNTPQDFRDYERTHEQA